MKSLHDGSIITGISVTSPSDTPSYHFYSRYFAPWNGIDEDPVNGSSHTILAPLWQNQLQLSPGARMVARQCSSRGGTLRVSVNEEKMQVVMSGNAVIVVEGHLVV